MAVDIQQGDVRLFQTLDEGDIDVEGGIVAMNGGLETAAYLSLFGGNEEDPGFGDDAPAFWGNLLETDPARKYRSQLQNLIQALPLTPGNLRRVEDSARLDLQWFLDEGIATSLEVTASIPTANRLNIEIAIVAEGEETTINFVENWKRDAES